MQSADDIVAILQELYDQTIISHGFTDDGRDYDLLVQLYGAAGTLGRRVFRFRACVEMSYRALVHPPSFTLDHEDIRFEWGEWFKAAGNLAYNWSPRSAEVYPGATYVADSARAELLTMRCGFPVHEASIETNVYELRLLFRDLIPQPLNTSFARSSRR